MYAAATAGLRRALPLGARGALPRHLALSSAAPLRSYSVKKPSTAPNDAPSLSSSSQPASSSASPKPATLSAASIARQRKLGPANTAKAKAQASASRALRERLGHPPSSSSASTDGIISPGAVAGDSASGSSALAAAAQDITQDELALSAAAAKASSVSPNAASAPSIAAVMPPSYQLKDVVAYATAEGYDFETLISSGRLPSGWSLLEDDEVIHIPSWPLQSAAPSSSNVAPSLSSGEAFIFRSGSYVTWGMSPEASRKFLRTVIRGRTHESRVGKVAAFGLAGRLLGGRSEGGKVKDEREPGDVEFGRYEQIGDEEMEYLMASDQTTRMVGDLIVIGQPPSLPGSTSTNGDGGASASSNGSSSSTPETQPWTPLLARVAFSQGLARSARLSVQESALSSYLESVAPLPAMLEKAGKVPLPRREVVRKMGTLLRLRQRANLDRDNFFDAPEVYWENGRMEHHYDSICESLDIEERFRALNEKLDHCENLLGVLRALLTENSGHRMELIIIYLIAFEAIIALISHDYIPSPVRTYKYLRGLADPAFAEANRQAAVAAAASEEAQMSATGAANREDDVHLTLGALHSALARLANAVGVSEREQSVGRRGASRSEPSAIRPDFAKDALRLV